jgi:hypothetical protein
MFLQRILESFSKLDCSKPKFLTVSFTFEKKRLKHNGTYEFLQRQDHFTIIHYIQRRILQTIHSGCDFELQANRGNNRTKVC